MLWCCDAGARIPETGRPSKRCSRTSKRFSTCRTQKHNCAVANASTCPAPSEHARISLATASCDGVKASTWPTCTARIGQRHDTVKVYIICNVPNNWHFGMSICRHMLQKSLVLEGYILPVVCTTPFMHSSRWPNDLWESRSRIVNRRHIYCSVHYVLYDMQLKDLHLLRLMFRVDYTPYVREHCFAKY